MKFMRALLFRLLILLILFIAILCFVFNTKQGVKLALSLSNQVLPGTLRADHIDGSFWKDLTLRNLTYSEKNRTARLGNAHLVWHINTLYPLHVTLEKLDFNQLVLLEDTAKWSLETFKLEGAWLRGKLHLKGNTHALLPQGMLKANISADGTTITGRFVLGENHVTIQGPVKGPWTMHAKLADLKRLDPNLAALNSTLIADAVLQDIKHATLKAYLTPGEYILPKGSTPKAIAFRHAAVDLNLTPKALNINGNGHVNQHITGQLALELPGIRLDSAPPPNQAINGDVHLSITSFDFLDEFIKLGEDGALIQNLAGKLHAVLHIAGALNKPMLTSEITLNQAHVTLPELGLTLDPIKIKAKTDAKNWEAHMLVSSNNGPPLNLDGNGSLMPKLTGSAVLHGDDIILMNTPEYKLKASPSLTLALTPKAYDVSGSILIPEAHMSPVSFHHTQKLSRDVVYSDEEKDPNPFNITANIMLDMGKKVSINLKGIQGLIDGQLHIKQQPKQAPTAIGKLKLRDGRYEAYGQKLNIEQGQLIFLGQQIDNPNLRVRAVRHFDQANAQFEGSNELLDFSASNLDSPNLGNNTTVGITVAGRIDSPRVKLFSKPPNLSQANILSMLLLGRPADQASKSGGAILLQAMSSMHLDSGTKGLKMLQDLQKSAGIDFDVQNSSLGTKSGDISKTSVMVGKSITKRIYLRYNVGLFQENSNVLTLTYLLNKFLNIKVTASDVGNGIDFTYNRSD
ncbi:MAG: translocation/assembly module TamB domain-containing protein [Legionellaceae bacterium]|nr:translocation/assembly module TamB domain-containing protein [Legionellaceae bacterium]